MKHFVLFMFFTLLSSMQLLAQVQFKQISDWELIRKSAAAEQKLIFIDAYTDWCTFCKEMDKTTFMDTSVARFLHSKFVCVKMEMEKNLLGKKIAMKYMVNSFPSFLIFDADGKLLYKLFGAEKPSDFIKTIEQTLNQPAVVRPGYAHQNLDIKFPDFYVAAFAENGKRKFPTDSTVNAFLERQKDKLTEISVSVMLRFSSQLNDKYLKLLTTERVKVSELYGSEAINSSLWYALNQRMKIIAKRKNEQEFNQLLAIFGQFIDADMEQRFYFYADYYRLSEYWEQYVNHIAAAKSSGMLLTSDFINSASWRLYLYCEQESLLKTSLEWMRALVEKKPLYAYLDTYAALLYKTKLYKDARVIAAQAIIAGKKENEDVKATEELIKRIEEKMTPSHQGTLKAE